MNVFTSNAAFITIIQVAAGLLAIGFYAYWLFNKEAKRKHLAELRKRFSELAPTDPEYNDVRALYSSMMADAERWSFSHRDSAVGHHHDTGSHGHDSGGFDDGGHHF